MRHVFLVLTVLLLSKMVEAQRNNPPDKDTQVRDGKFDPKKLVYGGNLGLNFGDFTFINLSPQVGYQFSEFVTAGVGVNYVATSIKTRSFNTGNELFRENYGYAGLSVFGRVFPTNFLFVSAQPEMNYSWGKIKYRDSRPDEKLQASWIPSFLVGAGAVLGGGNGDRGRGRGMLLSVQYDLAQDPRSPYGTRAFINIGYAF